MPFIRASIFLERAASRINERAVRTLVIPELIVRGFSGEKRWQRRRSKRRYFGISGRLAGDVLEMLDVHVSLGSCSRNIYHLNKKDNFLFLQLNTILQLNAIKCN